MGWHIRRPRFAVSIHAPARGATWQTEKPRQMECAFRSTPPHGGRPTITAYSSHWPMFRSTPPHGGRLLTMAETARVEGFDSRPRTGGDMDADEKFKVRLRVSIHAPARGATCDERHQPVAARVSIHAPARGATMKIMGRCASHGCFDPRPRTGGDLPPLARMIAAEEFRSTPPHGGRRVRAIPAHHGRLHGFDPRPRTGGDRDIRRPS